MVKRQQGEHGHKASKVRAVAKVRKAAVATARGDGQLAVAVRQSAQQIWLAGLGAFAKAQEEGQKVFQALDKEGTSLQKRTFKATGEKVGEVTGRVTQMADEFQKQANGRWDRLEGVFEERVGRALGRLGVPSRREVTTLTRRLDELTRAVEGLGGTVSGTRPRRARKATAAAATAAPAVAH